MNSFYTVQQHHQRHQLRGLSIHHQHPNHDVSQTERFFVPSSDNNNDDDVSSPWTILGCVLVVLIMCWCSKPTIPDRRFRRDRSYWMEQRDAKINRSLHIRQVVSADEAGNLQLGEIDDDEESANVASRVSSVVEDENEVACCSICLEPYRVGDKVAWTARDQEEECLHVFHYECILAWLENPKNDDCPTCRAKVMLDDDNGGTTSNKSGEAGEDDDEDDDHGSVNSSAFVIMHGLISRVRRASYSLIGKSVSVDSDGDAPMTSLSEPSPLRKAHTFGGGAGLFKRQSLLRRRSRSVSISEHSLTAEDEDDIQMVFPSSTKLVERLPPPGPVSLRRVASAGPSTPLRSGSMSRREQLQRRTDRIIREEETNTNHGIPAAAVTESQDSTELSESSSDLLLGRTFSSGTGGGSFPMMRQRSSSLRSSIREECERLVVDDLDHVESEEDGPRNPIIMRHSVSWARDIYDGETDRTEEDEIMRRVT